MKEWLTVERGEAPLVVSVPHAGTQIPEHIEARLSSPELARKDADFYVDRLYGFAREMGATIVRTAISRSVIDVNRDPSGESLYPGQATTGLCPVETFDGEPLYRAGEEPSSEEIAERRAGWFEPYHAALAGELDRLREASGTVVLYDAHSIRSMVPRLFDSELPQFNIGTDDGRSCAPALQAALAEVCAASGRSWVANGRFKGGWITRHYGAPGDGVHAIQMELAIRGYADEDSGWPPAWDEQRAAPLQEALGRVLTACLDFAKQDADHADR
ncbi:MAG: N-formylglutamate deformylase [Parasphingopyxis sp.]